MDNSYWSKELLHPLFPSISDVELYKQNIGKGSTLLLGCTHKLIPISDFQMDLNPWCEAPTMIVKDWRDNETYYDNIIGDGVLNFNKELTDSILTMCKKYCTNFVARSFKRKLENMKISDYFPKENDFHIMPDLIDEYDDYSFFCWSFYE
jgi:hypothetical protein